MGPQLITWSVFNLLNYSEILSAKWPWKDLCISKEKMVPSGIYDVVYHPYDLLNILMLWIYRLWYISECSMH